MADQQMVDQLCCALYSGTDNTQRRQAEHQLSNLIKVESLNSLKMIMEYTREPYTQFFVADSIMQVITANWSTLSQEDKLGLLEWSLNTLARLSTLAPSQALPRMVGTLCRLIKLGWLENQGYSQVPAQVHQHFLQSEHQQFQSIGLVILARLVEEMSGNRARTKYGQHAKSRAGFRDGCLLEVFKIGLTMLENVKGGGSDALVDKNLELVMACLGYDFLGLGMTGEDTSDDAVFIPPEAWKSILATPSTPNLFWDLYEKLRAPNTATCLQCCSTMLTLRLTYFTAGDEQKQWLGLHLTRSLQVMKTNHGLDDSDNYYHFCRCLSRFRSTATLGDVLASAAGSEWMQTAAQFTMESLRNWKHTNTTHFYLTMLWSKLAACKAPLRCEVFVPEVMQVFLRSRLLVAAAAVETPDVVDDMQLDGEWIIAQLEPVSSLTRLWYAAVGPLMVSLLDPVLAEYNNGTQMAEGGTQIEGEVAQRFEILEGQLASLVFLMGGVLSLAGGNHTPEGDTMDGDLTASVLKVSQSVQRRSQLRNAGGSTSLQGLTHAVLYSLQQFGRAYLGEDRFQSPLYNRLHELLGVDDVNGVLSVMASVVCHNLALWPEHSALLVAETLNLFCLLTNKCGARLVTLDNMRGMLRNHHGALEGKHATSKRRAKFYQGVTSLFFNADLDDSGFDQFMSPLKQTCDGLAAIQDPAQWTQPNVLQAFVTVLHTLRGICTACTSSTTYTMFFDWLFFQYSDMLERACSLLGGEPTFSSPLLKFLSEFVWNRNERIHFDPCCPNGLLLFKKVAAMLRVYAEKWLLTTTQPVADDQVYRVRYKSGHVCMTVMERLLSGGYCPFSAMLYYQDSDLTSCFDAVLRLALSIPATDLGQHKKLTTSYYSLMKVVFSNHTEQLCPLPTEQFMQLLHSLEDVLKSVEVRQNAPSINASAVALSYLTAFYLTHTRRKTQAAARLAQHFESDSQFFPRVYKLIFSTTLFEDNIDRRPLARPLLSMILANPGYYGEYQQALAQSLAPEARPPLQQAFQKLMNGVDKSLTARNTDKFYWNLLSFRDAVPVHTQQQQITTPMANHYLQPPVMSFGGTPGGGMPPVQLLSPLHSPLHSPR